MRSRIHLAALAAAAALSTVAATALADLAPPPGFVETCTLEKQKQGSDECYDCRAFHGNAEHCSASLKEYGFAQKCRTRGASVWGEVWCRAPSASAKKVPPEILGQLSNATNVLAAPPIPPTAAPTAPPPAATGTAVPAAPPGTTDPPPPVPPSAGGCGACAAPGAPIAPAVPVFAAVAAVAAWALRRRR